MYRRCGSYNYLLIYYIHNQLQIKYNLFSHWMEPLALSDSSALTSQRLICKYILDISSFQFLQQVRKRRRHKDHNYCTLHVRYVNIQLTSPLTEFILWVRVVNGRQTNFICSFLESLVQSRSSSQCTGRLCSVLATNI